MDEGEYNYDEFDMDNEYDEQADYNYMNEGSYLERLNSTNKYEILPQSTLFFQLDELIVKTSQMTALPYGWSLLLLREFKWNYEYSTEYFQDPSFYRQKIGYESNLLDPRDPKVIMPSIGSCDICCQEGQLLMNLCHESFCENCWNGHIIQSINSLNPFPKCMSCQIPLVYEVIENILKRNPLNRKYVEKYQKLLCELFSTANTSYQCCPGADCTNCIKCEDYNVTTVKCNCGKHFCFRCKNDDHSPCSCEERSKWLDMVLKEEADAKWMSLNTKICPWCNKAVERSAGCNFMACLCGKSFCYMCSKPWEPDHKDHFKCHIYKKKDDDSVNKEKAILQKMNFYAEKYLNANRNAIDLKKIDTFEKRKLLYEVLGIDLTDSDFIDQAYRFAIECCESLKWIYVFSYVVKFKNEAKKEAIEFTQGQYECYKEQLLKKLSFDLKNFLTKLQGSKDLPDAIRNQEKEEFFALRKNITNYYTCTKQFKEKFVEELEKLDSSVVRREDEEPPSSNKDKEKEKEKVEPKGKGKKAGKRGN